MELSQIPQISSDIKTKGFDLSAGKTWIYPENYPIREYQFNIVETCLYSNTLVCLPTGLGKTFIAAVVMYNFSRWYPCGKVVFLAPTKPLVTQQIFACHNIMGIPSVETIELTGAVNQKHREIAWSKKRVFFATPQVFHNDLEKDIVPSDLIRCIVIDEAHKALGKHSYCECIRILSKRNQTFRVLALSATPGNKIDNVQQVLQNLLIARVELRDETSSDIVPYINERKVDIILVPLSNELIEYKERYIFIMDRHVKVLIQNNILHGHAANISKGKIFHLLKEHQKKTNKSGTYGQIMKTLNILVTMYHAYELMVRDGLRAFHKFYQNHSDKFWMNEELQLQTLLEDINLYLGPFPNIKALRNDALVDIAQSLVFGHTKFNKLKELLLRHFKNHQEKENNTRAIVFVEYRDIVTEIYVLLLQCQPLIRPQMFVGQAGQKQKQQIKALDDFKNNHVNVLISTSIGEEGLDVGEVDLIICFDVSQHSPTRLVQRMGRTGRKRDGHIIILVTDGREHETLRSTMARRDSLNHKVLNKSGIFSSFYQNNPRMIPDVFTPECIKMHINVQPKSPTVKRKKGNEKLDKKENKRQNAQKVISTVETNSRTQKDGSKFSMMKYFKSDQRKEHSKNIFEILSSDVPQNGGNTIEKSDVKILSCDNDAVDFLTKCALRNSEKEGNVKNNYELSHALPAFSLIEHFLNFTVPDITILDCLNTLSDIVPQNSKENKLDDDGEDAYGNNSFNVNDCAFEDMMRKIDEKCIPEESKFEDLLDDSSISDNDGGFSRNEKTFEKEHVIEVIEIENKINTLQSLECGKFEDILNDTSDGSESNTFVSDFFQVCPTSTTIHNDLHTENSYHTVRSNDNTKRDEVHLQPATYHCTRNDKNDEGASRNSCKLNCDEFANRSTFSITQAIDEIARLNSKSIGSNVADNESDDDIFRDDSCLINNLADFAKETNDFSECKDENNLGSSEILNQQNLNQTNVEFENEEYDWDDDFEISIDTVQNCTKFDTFEEKSKKLVGLENNAQAHNSDSDEWFSVKKSFDISKENAAPCTSIAKKIVNVRKNLNSGRSFNDKDDTGECDSMISSEREKRSCYFLDDSRNLNNSAIRKASESRKKRMKQSEKYNRKRKLKMGKNEFIDDEAEVCSDDVTTDGSSGTDEDLDGFVSYTQNTHDTSDMHVHYLQSIKSPVKRHNAFLFKPPRIPAHSHIEIYSQPVTQLDESYINDSFCVAGDGNGDEQVSRIEELSELERAEQELERRKRKRKHSRNEEYASNTKKRMRRNKRKNIINYCSSSEDETERLREQTKNDSLLLAQSGDRN